MVRILPVLWGALHVGLVSAATWLVVASDLLDGSPVFYMH
jgi:hypothetical protein